MKTVQSNVVQTLRVFLASPGGVDVERGVVRNVASELSESLRRFGWQVEVLGWEPKGPRGGRAQSDINEDVRRCDIFLGILGDRWGTPTGDFTSGFEEEWSIASQRFDETGQPDLWIYFKNSNSEAAEGDGIERIREWRAAIESNDQAFHKSFDEVEDFTPLVRQRLLDEVLRRSYLTQGGVSIADVDWAAVYEQEPVSLLPNGSENSSLVDELAEKQPAAAADVLTRMANDAAEIGFDSLAEKLTTRACDIWVGTGKANAAVQAMRGILAAQVWNLRTEEARMLVDRLSSTFPPELASELRGWRACLDAPISPEGAAQELGVVLEASHGFELDRETKALWRAVYWRALMTHDPAKIVADDANVVFGWDEVQLELCMLRADALRHVSSSDSDDLWSELRARSASEGADHPELAAWISTRRALDAVTCEDLEEAEARYASAATKWTKVPGARSNASLAFFSAQCAMHLRRDWSFRGWSWRPIAAAQMGNPTGLAARGERLLQQALASRDEGKGKVIELIRLAIWCYKRAGFLDGVWRSERHLVEALQEKGMEAEAVAILCRLGSVSEVEKIVAMSTEDAPIASSLQGRWPSWASEARFAALAQVGTSMSSSECDEVILEAIEATESSTERSFDNKQAKATSALAAMSVGAQSEDVLERAVTRLIQLARAEKYFLAQPARMGLRMLDDVGLIDAADILTRVFVESEGPDEPSPYWLSQKLDDPERLDLIRRAALQGGGRALAALIAAGVHEEDQEIRQLCTVITQQVVHSDLGMTPDGKGIHGLMALDYQGQVGAASMDTELQRVFTRQLFTYATESRWPMVNRVRAIEGMWPMLRAVEGGEWLEELKVLASPSVDLDDRRARSGELFQVAPGELQATALALAAAMSDADPPSWLEEAIEESRFDERDSMRASSWRAAALNDRWFDDGAARYALQDQKPKVRLAAIDAWGSSAPNTLGDSDALRLANDRSMSVRLAVIPLLEKCGNTEAIDVLLGDHSAYVRGVAARRLRAGQA